MNENIRRKIAYFLVRAAKKIYPMSKEVTQFYSDVLMDYAIKGRTIVRVNDIEESKP